MTRAADIHDQGSLEAWLETQPREVSTAIAATAAYTADAATATARATTAAAANATAATAWDAVRTDAEQIEAATALQSQPLWPAKNPLQTQWDATRADWSNPASPYDFFRRWYETLLAPATHTPFPDAMLTKIALIDDAVWKEGAEAVAKEIAKIEAGFDAGEDDIAQSVRAMPPGAPDRVQATKAAMERHRADLPASFEAILGYVVLEVKRLQERNYRNDEDEEEAKRQIRTLTTLYHAIEHLQSLTPKTDEMPIEDAEQAEKLARLILRNFKAWPRDHADDVVGGVYAMGGEIAGNTIRMGLVAATAFTLPMIGVPTQWALGAGIAVFGNKTISDAAKMVKDTVFPSKP